ncbi:MAG: hypothetical protein M3Y72_04140 [Acidobacteriota bacterium]|nr:hypothetical protein [Acidobacteriota bacterium]
MRKLLFVAVAGVLISATGTVFGKTCDATDLRGSYAGTVAGHNTEGVPVAYQAIAHFDGSGGFSLSGFTYVANGAVLVSNASASGGTYTVNRDCSGSIQITSNGQTFKFAILITGPDLSQFQMLETDGSATTTGNAVKQEEGTRPQ